MNAYLQGQTFKQLLEGLESSAAFGERISAERIMREAKILRTEGRIDKSQHQKLRSRFNRTFAQK